MSAGHPTRRRNGPHRLAALLALVGLVCVILGFTTPAGELSVVLGLFLVFLAGGILNWDRRSGH